MHLEKVERFPQTADDVECIDGYYYVTDSLGIQKYDSSFTLVKDVFDFAQKSFILSDQKSKYIVKFTPYFQRDEVLFSELIVYNHDLEQLGKFDFDDWNDFCWSKDFEFDQWSFIDIEVLDDDRLFLLALCSGNLKEYVICLDIPSLKVLWTHCLNGFDKSEDARDNFPKFAEIMYDQISNSLLFACYEPGSVSYMKLAIENREDEPQGNLVDFCKGFLALIIPEKRCYLLQRGQSLFFLDENLNELRNLDVISLETLDAGDSREYVKVKYLKSTDQLAIVSYPQTFVNELRICDFNSLQSVFHQRFISVDCLQIRPEGFLFITRKKEAYLLKIVED